MVLCLLVATIIAITFWVYCRVSCGICKSSKHMVGKTVIVTGANSGIGFETAKDLANRGARVILACRNERRATAARDVIRAETGNPHVLYQYLDLTSLNTVRKFAENILKTENRLDVLINNAACYSSNGMTKDGPSLKMQTNHFGPFLLTNLLLPLLKSSAPSRIVNVSSVAHLFGSINLDNPTKKTFFNEFFSYSDTKLCNILMTVELRRRLEGTGVTVNAVHPGVVAATGLGREDWLARGFLSCLKLFWKTPWEGAQTTIYLAVAPELAGTSGRYFSDCAQVKLFRQTPDTQLARRLWEESEKICKC